MPRTPADIGDTEIRHQRGDGPGVRSNVMYHRREHIFITGYPEKSRIQRYFIGQVESVPRGLTDSLAQLACRPPGGIDHVPTKVGVRCWHDHLLWYTPGRTELRTQALVASHHVCQTRAQCVDIQRSADPQRGRHVVDR